MARSENTPDTPHYWDTMREVRYLPATPALVARLRSDRREASVARCTMCGQWTWGGVCTLHPEARQDVY
jgi:hypothetical protein